MNGERPLYQELGDLLRRSVHLQHAEKRRARKNIVYAGCREHEKISLLELAFVVVRLDCIPVTTRPCHFDLPRSTGQQVIARELFDLQVAVAPHTYMAGMRRIPAPTLQHEGGDGGGAAAFARRANRSVSRVHSFLQRASGRSASGRGIVNVAERGRGASRRRCWVGSIGDAFGARQQHAVSGFRQIVGDYRGTASRKGTALGRALAVTNVEEQSHCRLGSKSGWVRSGLLLEYSQSPRGKSCAKYLRRKIKAERTRCIESRTEIAARSTDAASFGVGALPGGGTRLQSFRLQRFIKSLRSPAHDSAVRRSIFVMFSVGL